jgi:hypothetical protein
VHMQTYPEMERPHGNWLPVRSNITHTNKQTPWLLVRKRIIPTDRLPLVDEI